MQRSLLDGDRARSHRVEQRAVVGDEQHRALERAQRVLERLAALDVEVVGRLVEDQDIRRVLVRPDQHGQRQAPALAAGQAAQRLLGLLAGEQEAPEQGARLVGRQTGGALRRLEHALLRVTARPQLLGVLREVPDAHVVARAQPARRELAQAGQCLDQRRLAAAIGADQRHVLGALEPHIGVVEQHHRRGAVAAPELEPRIEQLEDDASRALRRRERELQAARRALVFLDPLHLRELLDARLRLAGLRGLVAEALDEAFRARDLRPLGVDRPAERQLARGLLAPPLVPASGEEARAAR